MSHAPQLVTLRDSAAGSSAQILVSQGFNCFSFIAHFAGEDIEVLWADADFELGRGRPSGSGIPLLYPFPGRIDRGQLEWEGKHYELDANDGKGNAIHGFTYTRPWRVTRQSGSEVTGEFQASVDDRLLLEYWPADFKIAATYSLHGNRLSAKYVLSNPDAKPLPMGFGIHPYFRLPIGGEDAAECRIKLPVSGEWELEDLITTGTYFSLRNPELFQQGMNFGQMQFDNVFGGLVFEPDGWCRSSIEDPSSQRRLTIGWDQPFRECVVYTPPHREAICIEPYTCTPDAIRLTKSGIDAGLRLLQPGESLTTRLEMAVS